MKFNDRGYKKMEMSLNDYQHMSKRTMPNKGFEHDLINYTLGSAGETGEFVDHIKKWHGHGHELDREYLLGELGDKMHYIAGLATLLDFTLEEICTYNLNKLMKRYKDGFSSEASKARVDVKKADIEAKIPDGYSPGIAFIDEMTPEYAALTNEQLNKIADTLYRRTTTTDPITVKELSKALAKVADKSNRTKGYKG